MKTFVNIAKSVFASVVTFLTYSFGGFDAAIVTLFVFMVLDYVTGVAAAAFTKTLSSEIGFKGILRKLSILACVMVAVFLDRLTTGDGWVFRTLFCYFMIANEGLSILENAGKMGVPLPQKLLDALKQLKEE